MNLITPMLASLAISVGNTVIPLPAGLAPLDNPLKGYAAYSELGTTHSVPSAMAYVEPPWRELVPMEGQ